jgi:serine phosphatase RsbU (regulator of sigma subunit)
MARGARFAAAFLACYEASTGALWYINAGHTPALIYDEAFRELGASGVPLGLFSHAIHDAQITVLQPQSVFLLLSKGVVEMRAGRRQLRLENAKDLVAKRFANADELVSVVLEMAEASANSRSLEQNDRTAVALIRDRERKN